MSFLSHPVKVAAAFFTSPLSKGFAVVALALGLVGCAAPAVEHGDVGEDLAGTEAAVTARETALSGATAKLFATPPSTLPWQPFVLPGKRYVVFEPVAVLARPSLRVKADNSVSILRRRFEPTVLAPGRLAFSWKVDALPLAADLAAADAADSPVRIVLGFEGDRSRWTPKMHRLSEMSRLLTGEELPYATLIYVWGNKEAPGTVVVNPRTDRIRKLVLDSGTSQLGLWRDHVRDVQADFRQAFGEEPGPLRVVALMTDTDNTRSALTAWYGALTLENAAPAR
ncbi:DUF3047 domain-containing protein [Hydrogenophaga sp.]|uniref:DUF3047 domain-containing protein n=1 Tax=Hydrogenophaga sp. TaxID=1904254 RepID=UPI00272F4B51|nr:DUF3047 domain-containing protein [Hydrogenophaga sp.]MDP2017747.1 DUF3047 domain-containing protein [Hydrogenophaga sp.]MDP3165381.1 DUF3047 domain-containing protein [Hydrogenophaga sp.]MDP3811852.1 DUF3047 domain-containing protein [Hydrogenophaga sp.]